MEDSAGRDSRQPVRVRSGFAYPVPIVVRSNGSDLELGTWPHWSHYKGEKVQRAITLDQQNRWYHNTWAV
jgi:hypothetical protein